MRCVACNKNLNDFESTRKHAETGEFLDLCNKCFSFTGIEAVTNPNFEPAESLDMEDIDVEIDYFGEDDE